MYAFTLYRPQTVQHAADLLSEYKDAKLLAGGQTILPAMKLRLAGPSQVIDLSLIEGMSKMECDDRSLTLGAMTRHAEVNNSPVVQGAIPALAKLAGVIGDPAVRHMGTIGGSIANNDPNSDYPAACVALRATITTDKRSVEAEDFFTGMFATALGAAEIITKVSFSLPEKAGYCKFRNQASRFALVGVFVAKYGDDVRVAVTGAGASGVFRVNSFECALQESFVPQSLEGLTIPADNMNIDIHGSAEYRAHLVGVMARRAVADAIGSQRAIGRVADGQNTANSRADR